MNANPITISMNYCNNAKSNQQDLHLIMQYNLSAVIYFSDIENQ